MYWVAHLADGRRFRQVRWEPTGFSLYNPGVGMIPGCEMNLTQGHTIPLLWRFHLHGEGAHQHVHFMLDYERGTLVAEHLARAEGGAEWKWEPFGKTWQPSLGKLIYKARVKVDNIGGRSTIRVGLAPVRTYHLGIRFIAERNYEAAVGPLRRAEQAAELREEAFRLRNYALCLRGSSRPDSC